MACLDISGVFSCLWHDWMFVMCSMFYVLFYFILAGNLFGTCSLICKRHVTPVLYDTNYTKIIKHVTI